jgi:hypothetical protein
VPQSASGLWLGDQPVTCVTGFLLEKRHMTERTFAASVPYWGLATPRGLRQLLVPEGVVAGAFPSVQRVKV